jgi:hypothetical protein
MPSDDPHISDQELLLSADGELPTRRDTQVGAHLASCWNCRARMAEIEAAIIDFTRTHRQTLDPQLPPIDGPRALLRAQLAALASSPRASSWKWLPRFTLVTRTAAIGFAFLMAALFGSMFVRHFTLRVTRLVIAAYERGSVPDRRLTPGAVRSISITDACSMPHEEVIAEVPDSLRQEVLREYGITNAGADDYEIDYLIAPGLGGIADIHNLWPQPYKSHMWNAYVKDTLEEHLHQLVCTREVDLPTAQRDIATDWIAAYKKYFHTDKPLNFNASIARM